MARTGVRGNPCLDALLKEFECYGIKDYEIDESGSHLKVRWRHQGHHNYLTVAKTASDRRAPLNLRSDLRKQLHTAGIPRLSDLTERLRATPAFPKTQPNDGIDERIQRLASEMGAVTDWLLDITPAIHKLEQFAGMADAVEADPSNPRFRLRADIPPSLVGPLIAYLLKQGLGMESIKISPMPLQAISNPEERSYPRIALPPKQEQIAVPAPFRPSMAEAAPLSPRHETTAQSSIFGRGRKNGAARVNLLSHLDAHGAQTIDQLQHAGLRGYANRADRLSMLLSKLSQPEVSLIRRREDHAFELTPEGRAALKKLPHPGSAKQMTNGKIYQ